MSRRAPMTACLVFAAFLAPLATAQTGGANPPRSEAEVLSQKLDRVIALLQELADARLAEAELRRTDVALRALQVRGAAVARLEARERELADRVASTRIERDRVAGELEDLEDEVARFDPGSAFEAQGRRAIEGLERELESLAERLRNQELELNEMQLEVLDAKDGMTRLEELVEQGLQGL